jgi:hypothetical protein
VKNFHVDWGEDAAKMTAEERAAEINRVFDAIEAGDYEEIDFDELDSGRPKVDVRDFVTAKTGKDGISPH